MLQTLLTGLKQLLFALSHYGAKAHVRPGMPAAPLQASAPSLHAHCGEAAALPCASASTVDWLATTSMPCYVCMHRNHYQANPIVKLTLDYMA